jgi:hypothetical protein
MVLLLKGITLNVMPFFVLTFSINTRGIILMDRIVQTLRVKSALKTSFIADALAMPVHWYYQPQDIERAFVGSI